MTDTGQTEAERQKLTNAATEAERLRNDPALRDAIIAAHNAATDALTKAEAALVEAVLKKEPTGPFEAEVVQCRATISAINGLTTAIANAILRKPREIKPVA